MSKLFTAPKSRKGRTVIRGGKGRKATPEGACKRCASRPHTIQTCEVCRAKADRERIKREGTRRFTVERDGARVIIDPTFDVPLRAGARSARHAIRGAGEGTAIEGAVYPWMRTFDALPSIVETPEKRDGWWAIARTARRAMTRRVAGAYLALYLGRAARIVRFGRRFKGLTSPGLAYARGIRAIMGDAATRIGASLRRRSTLIDPARTTPDIERAIADGASRCMDRLDTIARRLEGLPRATLQGRYASVALSREVRARDMMSAMGPATIAAAREAMGERAIDDRDAMAERLMGHEGAMSALTGCASFRKARGSRARNARAAAVLKAQEKGRIARERAGGAMMRAIGFNIATATDDALAAALWEAKGQAASLRSAQAKQRKAARGEEKGALGRCNAHIAALVAEVNARRDEADRRAVRDRITLDSWVREQGRLIRERKRTQFVKERVMDLTGVSRSAHHASIIRAMREDARVKFDLSTHGKMARKALRGSHGGTRADASDEQAKNDAIRVRNAMDDAPVKIIDPCNANVPRPRVRIELLREGSDKMASRWCYAFGDLLAEGYITQGPTTGTQFDEHVYARARYMMRAGKRRTIRRMSRVIPLAGFVLSDIARKLSDSAFGVRCAKLNQAHTACQLMLRFG